MPRQVTLEAIASALGLPSDYFLEVKDNLKAETSQDEVPILIKIKYPPGLNLTDDQRLAIANEARAAAADAARRMIRFLQNTSHE